LFVFRSWYDEGMLNTEPLEPGIIKNFRLFIGIRLALVINTFLFFAFMVAWKIPPSMWTVLLVVMIDASLLIIYLSIPQLAPLFKQRYLPTAIIWATLGPMLEMYLGSLFISAEMAQVSIYFITPLPILVMFIPLVIVAWQYSKRITFFFCEVTLAADCIFVLMAGMDPHTILMIVCMALIRTALFLLVGNMINSLVKVQRDQRRRLIEANEHLVQYAVTLEQLTISRERNRMARELHDLMAHTMSGVAVELEGVYSMLNVDPQKAEKLLDHSLAAIRTGLMETRRALQALRSSPLEDLGLKLAIINLVDTLPGQTNYQIDLRMDDIRQALPGDVQQCFYRVAQEALSNIVTHARASKLSLCLQQEGERLKLSITDNGVGFNEKQLVAADRYGLLGMRERAEMIQAVLSINSQPGAGTRIELIWRP
jgi:signal transduction histidine kinase